MAVQRTRWYGAAPYEIWQRIVAPEHLGEWIGGRTAVVDEFVDGERLVFTWEGTGDGPLSQVEISVEPEGEGTRVTVVERALEPAPTVPIGFQARASTHA